MFAFLKSRYTPSTVFRGSLDVLAASNQRLLNRTGTAVAISMMVMLGSSIYALIYETIPANNQNALLVLIGALTTNVTAVVSFFFGASAANRIKDDTVNSATNMAREAQARTPSPPSVPPLP